LKFPVIELRSHKLFVLNAFGGTLSGSTASTRHNLAGNLLTHLIDSNGSLWSFTFRGTDHRGIRRAVSWLWNISSDQYSFERRDNISLATFREIVSPFCSSESLDSRELAESLLEPVATLPPTDALKEHIALLNL
jgi:hypothetical protein